MIVDVMSPPYVILLVLGYYVFWGMQGWTSCASLAVRKWRENEKLKRKWGENEEMERDLFSTFPHFFHIFT